MWWRSASFILDRQNLNQNQNQNDAVLRPDSSLSMSPPTQTSESPNPKNHISAYYQTRAAHHAVVTTDWLAQAQAAADPNPDPEPEPEPQLKDNKPFSVIEVFNNWRKQPHLAEAVAAIRALAAVIRSSHATTMMELEIELKKASDSLKVTLFLNAVTAFDSLIVN